MVVCKCRKATKLYCFVHKVPVCGECICFPEHHICVVRTYSEWVIDGEYDWPPRCCMCQLMLEDAIGPQTTRLGCLHVMHTNCLVSHIKCFPPQTAPAGYVCPTCSTPIWPPKSVKDSGSRLHSKLKEAIMQTDAKNNLLGNQSVSSLATDFHGLPPAFDSDPLVAGSRENKSSLYAKNKSAESANLSATEIRVIDEPNSGGSFMRTSSPPAPGAATRKGTIPFERQNSEISCNADDEDGGHKKYNRRGPIRHKLLTALLPFWSSALPTLPVTAPPRKDASTANEVREGRSRHQKSSRMDPRKILLLIAIVACMATMSILYYRIAQQDPGEELPDDERQ